MEVRNLHFFDRDGYNMNLTWDDIYGCWVGNVYFPKVSVGLYANTDIYVMEMMYSVVDSTAETAFVNEYYVLDDGKYYSIAYDSVKEAYYYENDKRVYVTDSTQFYSGELCYPSSMKNETITFGWDKLNKFVDEFFMFTFDEGYITKDLSSLTYRPQDGPDVEVLDIDRYGGYEIKLTPLPVGDDMADERHKVLPIHVAFSAAPQFDATTYNRTLIMKCDDVPVARFTFYAETVEEDERLKIWNSNLGYNITPEDEMIFKKSDIN